MAQTMSGFTGDQLLDGRYRLIEPIGTGGMSTVWRARDERLGRVVAVKTLGRRLLADRTAQRRLAAEARTLARLSHPHIAVVHDYGVARVAGGVVPYLVMEVVDGTPLATVLAERDLGWPAAVGVCAQVASAVAAAHARGVVHRDISANNVLLADTGVTVIDFGISGFVDQPADTETFGTPAYTAPERLDGAPVHPAADVYALGVLLYRCLTGRLPWPPTSLVGLLSAHRNRDPRPLPDIAGLPPQVADMCLACLEKDPAARPDAETVAEVLAAALDRTIAIGDLTAARTDEITSPAHPVTQILAWPTQKLKAAGRGRRRSVVAAGGVIIVLLAGLGVAQLPTGSVPYQPAWTSGTSPSPGPSCSVTYQVTVDSGQRFTADLTVTNLGDRPRTRWRLSVAFPGGQQLDEALTGLWQQTGTSVTSRPQDNQLPSGGVARLSLTGTYDGVNPLPTDFSLDGVRCLPVILSTVTRTAVTSSTSSTPAATTGKGKGRRHGHH